MRKKQIMEITSHTEIADSVFEMTLKGELVNLMQFPGQFVNVKVSGTGGNDPLLRRPISICNINHEALELTLVYRVAGIGTKILSTLEKGTFVDILGPLGNGYDLNEIPSDANVLLVGGGIGVPPMYLAAKQLHARGNRLTTVIGFASKKDVFYEAKFAAFGDVYVTTMDGTHGFKGHTVALIEEKNLDFDYILACGPHVMLHAIDDKFKANKKGFLSFEERMACGIGACYACVCDLHDGKRGRICKDGPIFKLGEVNFDE